MKNGVLLHNSRKGNTREQSPVALTKQTHIYGYVVNSIYASSSMNKPCVNLRIGKIEWVEFKSIFYMVKFGGGCSNLLL